MAKKYTSNNKNPDIQTAPSAGSSWLGIVAAIAFVFLLTLAGSMDNVTEKWTGLLSAVLIMVLLFASKRSDQLKYFFTPLFFAATAHIIWGGISTFYAASGKFAIFEFSKLLVAFCVYLAVLFFTDQNESGLKRVAYVLSSAGCFWGIISVDAASSGFLSNIFKGFIGLFTQSYAQNGAFEQGIRITSITGNPNIYAGFMALTVLFSLYLAINADSRRSSRITLSLLAVNSLSYLLAFSMGSLFMFLIACLVMLGISEKGCRISLFLLMLETAILAFAFAFLSIAGLGKAGAISFVPIFALALNAFFLYQLDGRLRPLLNQKLSGNSKRLLGAVLVIVILLAGYSVAAMQVSGEMKLDANETVMRAIYVGGGEYTLAVESSEPVNINIESQNKYDLMQRVSKSLYVGMSDQEISFTVPDDAEIVKINLTATANAIQVVKASYSGSESGNVHLNYPLLPDFVANRIQDLFANENAIQRTVFFEDGIKLFSKSPIIGRGLGGFENGTYAVQDFYYETKYTHNHYIQVLSDLGIVGLVFFLSILASSIISIVLAKRKGRSLYAVPVLAACVMQIFGQAATDAIWSTGIFLGFTAAVLALITVFCSAPFRLKESFSTDIPVKIEKTVLTVFAGVFILLLSANLYAQSHAKAGVKDFKDIERLISIDRFEYNDYKLSYLVNAPGTDDPEVLEKAVQYAKELSTVESNSLTPYLASYDFATYMDYDAFEAAKTGIENAKSYPGMWIRLFDVFEEYIDPVGAHTDDAAERLKSAEFYVNSVLELYDTLLERNRTSLDKITLSPYNNAFIGKLLEIRETHLYSIDWVFTAIMTYAFDSECAVDANLDGIPDSIALLSGSINRNQDGLLAVPDNTMIDLTLYHKLRGQYTFMVKTDTPQGIKIAMDGTEKNVLYTDNEAYVLIDLDNNSDMNLSKFTVTFPSATVIDSITYTTKLE